MKIKVCFLIHCFIIFFLLFQGEVRADFFNDMMMFFIGNENINRSTKQKNDDNIYNLSRNCEYVCAYCGESITEIHTPDKDGCSKNVLHSWHYVGKTGDIRYSCSRCAAVVYTQSIPIRASCYGGNVKGFYEWERD